MVYRRYARRFKRRFRPRRGVRRFRRMRSRYFAKRVKKVIGRMAESKTIRIDLNALGPISNAWNETFLLNIFQGTNSAQYIGRSIAITSISMYGTLEPGVSGVNLTDDSYNRMRIILSWQKGVPLGAGPLFTALTTSDIDGIYNKEFGGTQYLHDKLFDKHIILHGTPQPDGGGYDPVLRRVVFRKRYKVPKKITMKSDAINTLNYSLWLSMLSDSTAIPHPAFMPSSYLLIRYIDI